MVQVLILLKYSNGLVEFICCNSRLPIITFSELNNVIYLFIDYFLTIYKITLMYRLKTFKGYKIVFIT